MFCPWCAAQNNDDGKYCRGCGAELALVSKAMKGDTANDAESLKRIRRDHRHPEAVSLQHGVREGTLGVGFLIVALILFFSHNGWGLWLLIPAFALLGKGLGAIL